MSGHHVHVGPADAAHASAITDIYNDGIRGREATFETTERTVADVLAWFKTPPSPPGTPHHPMLVATTEDGTLLGWIRASAYRARPAYRTIAEYAVYVARHAQGKGVGDALMSKFVVACSEAGITKLVSRIFPDNVASLALCDRHGFRRVGTYHRHGMLDGVWRDVVVVERIFPENMQALNLG